MFGIEPVPTSKSLLATRCGRWYGTASGEADAVQEAASGTGLVDASCQDE